MGKIKVVAEMGANHQGDFETAKKMIRLAADFCMVDVVKFAKRTIGECLTEEQYNAPHPNPIHAFGSTYGEHREALEFTIEQHGELKEYARAHGHRLTMHPGQFAQLGSPRREIVEQTYIDLEIHAQILRAMGLTPEEHGSVMIIHGGGAFEGKKRDAGAVWLKLH